MNDDFKPIGTNLPNIDFSKLSVPQFDLSFAHQQTQAIQSAMDAVQAERERKVAVEEAYRQETIRSLRAIEQNTANLYTLVDLISKSTEQQDELITIIADILTIAKAKDKKEAESIYKKVMAKITQTVKDGETLAKVAGYATTVYELVKPIIENLKV